ncbi:MAG: hypothetical protein ACYC3I_14685, partial [Gemmataceae bacterium]
MVNREVFRAQRVPTVRALLSREPVGHDLSQLLERVGERPVLAHRLMAVYGVGPLRKGWFLLAFHLGLPADLREGR